MLLLRYIHSLHTYLTSFMRRTQPLVDTESDLKDTAAEFDKKWEAVEIEGWSEISPRSAQANGNGSSEGIWCTACTYFFHNSNKMSLFHLAPRHTGQKMYSKQTVYDAHLSSKKHIKATAKQATNEPPPTNPNGPPSSSMPPPSATNRDKHIIAARLTYLTTSLLSQLVPILNDTKSNVERRFSLTAREREQELLEQSQPQPPANTNKDGEPVEEEEEEERIYNPLKLPLGWDGKPIPYWLYKLHGLGVEYRCEICSDHIYMGRRVS